MTLPKIPLVVLDTETTGFVPRVHRIIEYAAVTVIDGKISDEYEELFAIDEEIPPHVQAITRIYPEDLDGKEKIENRREMILEKIPDDAIIVGQNIAFDIRMLKGEGIDLSDRLCIDTAMLASLVFPELKSYSLGYVSEILKLSHEPKHRALGDVRATLELLSRAWERLSELPTDAVEIITQLSSKAPDGYRTLFADLQSTNTDSPSWLQIPNIETYSEKDVTQDIATHEEGIVIAEESLDPHVVEDMIHTLAMRDDDVQYWIAVKNLERAVRRHDLPKNVSVLYPPNLLVCPQSVKALLAQESLTDDELTLAIKLYLYDPTKQFDLPIHGDEYRVWDAKVGCTVENDVYKEHINNLSSVVLCDHYQLLQRLQEKNLPASEQAHIVIDDASMLEDTATKALGRYLNTTTFRAAAEGNDELMKLADLLQLWVEKTRQQKDLFYLNESALHTPECKGLMEQLTTVQTENGALQTMIDALRRILSTEQFAERITWIETYRNDDTVLQTVPRSVGAQLDEYLYQKYPVTLLAPPASETMLSAIIPSKTKTSVQELAADSQISLNIAEWDLKEWIQEPDGKTIILCASRKQIEDIYVQNVVELEKKNVTLLCQGLSGGQSRMQAEFEAAPSPVVLVMTPWMYEGLEISPDTVDHLMITSLPFDHPNHAVIQKRAEQYKSAFMEYNLPRVILRMFRLLRTFSRHKKESGDVLISDMRLQQKEYGKTIAAYLDQFAIGDQEIAKKPVAPKKESRTKDNPLQQPLF